MELLDIKCYVRLNEVASSLIKMAPYDQESESRNSHHYALDHNFGQASLTRSCEKNTKVYVEKIQLCFCLPIFESWIDPDPS